MSLINDALKKAQKQRTGESTPLAAMPSVGGESAARIAKRAQPVGFNSLLIRLGLGAGAVLVLVVGGYFVMRLQQQTMVPQSATAGQPSGSVTAPVPPPTAPTTENREPRTEPAVTKPVPSSLVRPPSSGVGGPAALGSPKPSSVGGFVLPVVTPPPPTPEPVVVKKPEPLPANAKQFAGQTPGLQQQTTVPHSAPALPAAAKFEPRAITFIESLRIAGIRASATDSKVLMNDRVYRVGNIVEHEMNLKLIGITANSLTFEDERGGRYTRQF